MTLSQEIQVIFQDFLLCKNAKKEHTLKWPIEKTSVNQIQCVHGVFNRLVNEEEKK